MINFNDHKNEDGSTDWESYRKAQIDAGDRCYKCDVHISNVRIGIFARQASPQMCQACQHLADDCSVEHEQFFRCPVCGEVTLVFENEYYELCQEGEHNVTCPDCDHKFEVITTVTYSFESPERITQEEAQDA